MKRLAQLTPVLLSLVLLPACGSDVIDSDPSADDPQNGGRDPEYGGEGQHEVTLYADDDVIQGYDLLRHEHFEWDRVVHGEPSQEPASIDVSFLTGRYAVLYSKVEQGFCVLDGTYSSIDDVPASGDCIAKAEGNLLLGLMGFPLEGDRPRGMAIIAELRGGQRYKLFLTGGSVEDREATLRFLYASAD